jgi:hypothetical protein
VDSTSGHPLIGHFAPDGWVSAAGRRERIRTLFGTQFVAVYFAADASEALRFLHEASTRRSALPTRQVLVLPPGVEIGDVPGQVTVVHDEDPALRTDYHVRRSSWMLIRPDGHISAAGEGFPGWQLPAALLRCARGTGHQRTNNKANNKANNKKDKKELTDVAC